MNLATAVVCARAWDQGCQHFAFGSHDLQTASRHDRGTDWWISTSHQNGASVRGLQLMLCGSVFGFLGELEEINPALFTRSFRVEVKLKLDYRKLISRRSPF